MSAHVLMALQVHADDEGFVDLPAAFRRAGVARELFSRELCSLIKRDIVRSANRTRGVKGVLPETCFQIVEAYR